MPGVVRVSRAIVVAIAAVLALPGRAHAALTPLVDRAAAPDRHPTVTWTLPPNVEAEAVEVATKPTIGDHDQFLEPNVLVGMAVASDATSWTDTRTRLDPGRTTSTCSAGTIRARPMTRTATVGTSPPPP